MINSNHKLTKPLDLRSHTHFILSTFNRCNSSSSFPSNSFNSFKMLPPQCCVFSWLHRILQNVRMPHRVIMLFHTSPDHQITRCAFHVIYAIALQISPHLPITVHTELTISIVLQVDLQGCSPGNSLGNSLGNSPESLPQKFAKEFFNGFEFYKIENKNYANVNLQVFIASERAIVSELEREEFERGFRVRRKRPSG